MYLILLMYLYIIFQSTIREKNKERNFKKSAYFRNWHYAKKPSVVKYTFCQDVIDFLLAEIFLLSSFRMIMHSKTSHYRVSISRYSVTWPCCFLTFYCSFSLPEKKCFRHFFPVNIPWILNHQYIVYLFMDFMHICALHIKKGRAFLCPANQFSSSWGRCHVQLWNGLSC